MLFDWLVTGQVVPSNPAVSVVARARRPDRQDAGARNQGLAQAAQIDHDHDTLRDLRDRALIATLTYSFARITAALKMKVEDLRPRGAGWSVRLHEKAASIT